MEINPILLAGGSGTRLWPLSRKSFPKQFSNLIGATTLFQSTALRLMSSDIVKFAPQITLTNAEFRFIVGEQLQGVNIDPGPILIEPEAKNTASAILAASIFVFSRDKEGVLLVVPSDHLIPDVRDFHEAIKLGLPHTQDRKIVTFGVNPTRPETGYGYLELSTKYINSGGSFDLLSFVEKPSLKDAEDMLAAGNFFWNTGIFLFRAVDMIDAFRAYAPRTLDLASRAVDQASQDLGFLRLAAEPWSKLENISIDYAVMEKATNLVAVPFMSKWSDLGGWDAVWSESHPDLDGNVASDTAHAIECCNTLLRSESNSQQVIGIGLENIAVIAMPDAVLVASRDRLQLVKEAVDLLKSKNITQAEVAAKNYRPWGWFESIALGDSFQVKHIFMKPGSALSLQSHRFRSEHWVIVEGVAKVTIAEDIKLFTKGQSVYVPLGVKHRIENPGKIPVHLIEVQIGTYLGEDDIIRYEDIYARN